MKGAQEEVSSDAATFVSALVIAGLAQEPGPAVHSRDPGRHRARRALRDRGPTKERRRGGECIRSAREDGTIARPGRGGAVASPWSSSDPQRHRGPRLRRARNAQLDVSTTPSGNGFSSPSRQHRVLKSAGSPCYSNQCTERPGVDPPTPGTSTRAAKGNILATLPAWSYQRPTHHSWWFCTRASRRAPNPLRRGPGPQVGHYRAWTHVPGSCRAPGDSARYALRASAASLSHRTLIPAPMPAGPHHELHDYTDDACMFSFSSGQSRG